MDGTDNENNDIGEIEDLSQSDDCDNISKNDNNKEEGEYKESNTRILI